MGSPLVPAPPDLGRRPVLERYAAVLRSAPAMVWMGDATGEVTFVNRTWLAFTGRRLKEALADGWVGQVHPADRAECLALRQAALRTRRAFNLEYRLRRADGVYRLISESALPLYEDRGPFAGYVGTCVDVTGPREAEDELRSSRHRLRDLSARLEHAREEERRELARVLHDELGQLLTGVRLEVATAIERFREAGAPANVGVVDHLQGAVGLVDLSIATVRRITTSVRPPILDHLGLVSAIKWEAALFQQRTGIRCRTSCRPAGFETHAHVTALYRILQEALTNVARHANAGTVRIHVRQRGRRLTLEVRDNGRGITDDAMADRGALGLLGMRERALAAGGDVRIARLASGGTSVAVTVPLDRPSSSQSSAADA